MDTLTLTAGGVQLVLFAPRPVSGGIEALAVETSATTPRARTFRTTDKSKKYRVPALPFEGFRLVHVVLPEVGT